MFVQRLDITVLNGDQVVSERRRALLRGDRTLCPPKLLACLVSPACKIDDSERRFVTDCF